MNIEATAEDRARRAGIDLDPIRQRVASPAWDAALRTYARMYDGAIRAAQRASERGLDADGVRDAALSHIRTVWLAED